jgi:hypothetical protein
MKKHLLVAALLGLAGVVLSSPAAAQCGCYCGKWLPPPCSDDACKRACGWRAPSPAPSTAQPSNNNEADRQRQQEAERQRVEAERQRQREIEAQRQREEEEARFRQQEFERKKQEALSSMKDIAGGELGLKGGDAGDLGLKDVGDTGGGGLKDGPNSPKPACKWGDQGSAVVDLRCLGLDPDKPIAVDPHVVRGQERVFPAQIDPATFENANYKKGSEAMMRRTFSVQDAMDAVAYFKAARLQRPNDPLVRNSLLLAQDIVKARQQTAAEKEKADEDSAMYTCLTLEGYAALEAGDKDTAGFVIGLVRQLQPDDTTAQFVEALISSNYPDPRDSKARRDAYALTGYGLEFIGRRNTAAAIPLLAAAHDLQPEDKVIGTLLREMRKYQARMPPAEPPARKPTAPTSAPGARQNR